MYFLCTDLSMTSAEAVILTAFGSHFLKEVTRSQLESAAKSLLSPETVHQIKKNGDKGDFIIPIAEALLKKGTIKIEGSSDIDLKNLAREELKKVGPL